VQADAGQPQRLQALGNIDNTKGRVQHPRPFRFGDDDFVAADFDGDAVAGGRVRRDR
jgi:hypothetical protein